MQEWNAFLQYLSKELGEGAIKKWLLPLKVVHFDACNLYLEAENPFQIDWFEEHVRQKASKLFLNANAKLIKIHITCIQAPSLSKEKKIMKEEKKPSFTLARDSLLPEYTADSFIFNSSNEILFSLFSKLASGQENTFNPIVLYGGPSSGKTHFLQALAQQMLASGKNALYVKMETFTENCVSAIRCSSMQEFRKAYRQVDALLVDNIEHLSGKTTTQEEFFHTFNALHSLGKQLVLTSTSAPSMLSGIEPRLTSRFEWGLSLPIAQLNQKDVTLVAKNKCDRLGLCISEPVLQFLLETFSFKLSSIQRACEALYLRTLEKKQVLTKTSICSLLHDLIQKEKQLLLTPDKLLSLVAHFYGIDKKQILSKSQTQESAIPRQLAMFFCRESLKMPFTKIGQFFQRDHSTVMTSVRSVEEKLSLGDAETQTAWMKIKQKIEQEVY